MIDIHTHLLFGIDDGCENLHDTLSMAEAAVKEGIHTLIATPHHKNGRYENSKDAILLKTGELNEVLKEKQIPLTVLPGQEPRIYGEILEDYRNDEILTLNNGGQYLFIELPSSHVPRYTEKLLYEIQMEGLTPIIVHPERNQEIIQEPDILYRLVNNGALTQVTASSLTGHFGKKIKKFSCQLIEANLTHFISSDVHNLTHRPYRLSEAYDKVDQSYGIDTVFLFTENAELLVQGLNVYKEPPEKVKTKKFLGLF